MQVTPNVLRLDVASVIVDSLRSIVTRHVCVCVVTATNRWRLRKFSLSKSHDALLGARRGAAMIVCTIAVSLFID
jgi:hypothetical protein